MKNEKEKAKVLIAIKKSEAKNQHFNWGSYRLAGKRAGKESEHKFVWTDTNEPITKFWNKGEPNNFRGVGENCVNWKHTGLNDFPCNKRQWSIFADPEYSVCKRERGSQPQEKQSILLGQMSNALKRKYYSKLNLNFDEKVFIRERANGEKFLFIDFSNHWKGDPLPKDKQFIAWVATATTDGKSDYNFVLKDAGEPKWKSVSIKMNCSIKDMKKCAKGGIENQNNEREKYAKDAIANGAVPLWRTDYLEEGEEKGYHFLKIGIERPLVSKDDETMTIKDNLSHAYGFWIGP